MKCAVTASTKTTTKEYVTVPITYRSLFWLFLFGSVAGFVLEGLWCILEKGAWESHTATIWGPFCVIYGFGAATVYLLSTALKGKGLPLQFILFSIIGALVEYFGSLFQEIVYHSMTWDYSDHFMNIDGRVSLPMSLIWGVLGTASVRFVFPAFVQLLNKMEGKFWRIGCIALSVFMAVNLLLSSAAVMRWKDRLTDHTPAANAFEQLLDNTYDIDFMKKNY
ncbi:MAG: putative ABC transporter permease, partial [Oscillospiraceae bacterium]|nr:putative ABC transporter permease [Oscillospiraceae bacterium]